ncbi:chemotaxis protein CheW [Pseudanabaena sp. PCC 6802]|uniref:chemotaxis protein CheW n=1 Tax=Pseudanabaena sp. PCC 6802 TaxID=118173 RepID=UPI00034B60B1|nr:chemotaxis protein CheW [Pseudanabaena sp. PCC 6802]
MGTRDRSSSLSAAKSTKVADPPTDRYLEIQANSDTTLALPMASVQEVLTIEATNIVPIPNMPACILGILNRHSRVYWAIDLATLLACQSVDMVTHNFNVVIAIAGGMPIAIVVHKVIGMVTADRLESTVSHFPAHLQPYLQGRALQANRELAVIKVEAILQTPGLF